MKRGRRMVPVREQTTDRNGKPLTAGTRVRVAGGAEGTIVRVLDDHGMVTVVLPEGRGQVERMIPVAEVEAL